MKALNRLDIAIALVFGGFIFFVVSFFQKGSYFEYQIHLNSTTNYIHEMQDHEENNENSKQPNQIYFSSQLLDKKKSNHYSRIQYDTQIQTSDSMEYDQYADSIPEFFRPEENIPNSNLSSTEYENQKIEDYIVNHLGFSENISDRVLSAKSRLESQILQVNQLGVSSSDHEDSQSLILKANVDYQDELLQILGFEAYQKFVKWNSQLEADIAEMHAGGRVTHPISSDLQLSSDFSNMN